MTKGNAVSEHESRAFNRWLTACAIVASLFAGAIVAIVFAHGPFSAAPSTATAKGPGADTDFTSSTKPRAHEILSVQDLMKRIDLEKLPSQTIDEPY
jgi:hypothetical protein